MAEIAGICATRYWRRLDDGRVECTLCPRFCQLREGKRGVCFVRMAQDGEMVLTTYGRSSGFCIDPIEKKPLFHFLPGTPVLSFGTAGCNLTCRFCQNWDISKSRQMDTSVWLELTTLLIPGENDSDAEILALCDWIGRELGPEVPLHFTAFHPDFQMLNIPATPAATLQRARQLALNAGLHHVYTGNSHDKAGESSWCPGCGTLLIERDWYQLGRWALTNGACPHCARPLAGYFEAQPGIWGPHRLPLRLEE